MRPEYIFREIVPVWSRRSFHLICSLYYILLVTVPLGLYILSKFYLVENWIFWIVVASVLGSMFGIDSYYLLFNYEKYKNDYVKTYGKAPESKE